MADILENMLDDLKPVKQKSIIKLVSFSLVSSFLIAAFFMVRAGFRPDIGVKLTQWTYILGLVSYLLVFVCGVSFALMKAFPSYSERVGRPHIIALAVASLVAISAYAGFDFTFQSVLNVEFFLALGCCMRISFGAVFPTLVVLAITRKLAPQNEKAIMGFGWLSAAAAISTVSQLNCPIDDFAHILVGHGLLLIGFGTVVALVFAAILRILRNKRLSQTKEQLGLT